VILPILGGAYLGWSLGANNASNVIGAAVTSRMLRFTSAAVLCSVFLIFGAILQGSKGIQTLHVLTPQTAFTAGLTAIAAALTVTIMTLLKLPISASQAVVGAILGIGMMQGEVNLIALNKVIACWIGTPVGAMVLAAVLYPAMALIYNRLRLGMFRGDAFLRLGLIVISAYGSYALGANNVANVSSFFSGGGMIDPFPAALLGSVCIALGVLTFGRRVMETVGKDIVKLDAFSSLVVLTSEAITVHVYAVIGVPVSTSQAVIGAVLGVGIARGSRSVRLTPLRNIGIGWLLTPAVACALSALLHLVTHLRYAG
jgi:PiT family inorganic phosphate transporter